MKKKLIAVLLLLCVLCGACGTADASDVAVQKDGSWFSDFEIVGDQVNFYCFLRLKNTGEQAQTVSIYGSFDADARGGLVTESRLLAHDTSNPRSTAFYIPAGEEIDVKVVFTGTFAGTAEKHDRLLPALEIVSSDGNAIKADDQNYDYPAENDIEETAPPQTSEAPTEESTEAALAEPATVYLSQNDETCFIKVAYPQFPSPEYEAINTLIEDYVRGQAQAYCNGECAPETVTEMPPDISWDDLPEHCFPFKYRLTLSTEDTLSIVFDGFYNRKTAAHPTNLLLTLNIDPRTAERIALADRYVIDDALYETFAAYAEADLTQKMGGWPENWQPFSEMFCRKERFLNGLDNVEALDPLRVFFTEEGLGITYSTGHAFGDHLEIVLPYHELTER